MHLTEKQCFDYANRALDPAALLSVDEHLSACAACCQKLSSVLQAKRGETEAVDSIAWELTASEEEFHLSFPYLAAYVDQQLEAEERERISSHLEVCSTCRAEIADLQAFKQTLSQPKVSSSQSAAGWRAAWQNLRHHVRWVLPAAAVGVLLFVFYSKRPVEPIAQQQPAPVVTPLASPRSTPFSDMPEPSPAVLSTEERAVQIALTTGRLEIPAEIKTLRTKGGNLMSGQSGASTFAIIAPQGVMVESEQPRLQWTAVPEVKQYVVTVTNDHFKEVAKSIALTETSWAVPVRLKRDAVYFWQVEATTMAGQHLTAPAQSAPEAKFKVLSPEAIRLVRRARQRYAASPLELGVIYARVGLLAEAAQELKLASRQSSVARRLLQQLQQELG